MENEWQNVPSGYRTKQAIEQQNSWPQYNITHVKYDDMAT